MSLLFIYILYYISEKKKKKIKEVPKTNLLNDLSTPLLWYKLKNQRKSWKDY